MNKQNDRKLFENVNKYLYDTPKRTEVCMDWVNANCEVVRADTIKEVIKILMKIKEPYFKKGLVTQQNVIEEIYVLLKDLEAGK